MKKKLLAMLLAVVMAFCLLPGTAFAASASGSCGANVTWSYSNGTLTIQGTGPMNDYDNLTQFAPWYDYREQIHTVRVGDGVTNIGEFAFVLCRSLTSVTIPNSVTAIGQWAFINCSSLTSVTIPNGVTTIGTAAFISCNSLTGITIPNGVTTIEDSTFSGCSSLTSVTIPDSVTSIGRYAFYNCGSLTSVAIPGSVTTIGGDAFAYCNSLTSVTIPGNVTTIYENTFKECNRLADVYYGGNANQWKQISIDRGNDPLTSAAIHYNSAIPGTTPTAPTFTDVPAGEWYADAVAWAVENEITNGTGNGTTFSPKATCTHAQILTMLYRAARGGGTAATDDMTKAVSWAQEKGMIDDTFDGSKSCSRADAVTYIWQAFDKPGAATSSFIDVPPSAACAKAVDWAVEKEVTNGTNPEKALFSPDGICTRGHIVTFLYRAYNN